MNQKPDLAAKIEKSRRSLLRLVGFLLFVVSWAAKFTRRFGQRPSIGFIEGAIFKLEATTGYLIKAAQVVFNVEISGGEKFLEAANIHRTAHENNADRQTYCLENALGRLKALRSFLRRLAVSTKHEQKTLVNAGCSHLTGVMPPATFV